MRRRAVLKTLTGGTTEKKDLLPEFGYDIGCWFEHPGLKDSTLLIMSARRKQIIRNLLAIDLSLDRTILEFF